MEDSFSETLTRKHIIIGVISSLFASFIFLIFLQPLLGLLWRFVLSNIAFINDMACRTAAVNDSEKYSFLLFVDFISGLLFFIFFLVVVREILDRPVLQTKIVHLRKRNRWITALLLTLGLFALILTVYLSYLERALRISFQQRLAVLTPKISDQERKELLASWASMTNEGDYRRIVDEMEQKAKANGITLPKFRTGAAPSK